MDLIPFLDASPTAFHAAEQVAGKLKKSGFSELLEIDSWALEKGSGYFVRRQGSSIIAFVTGSGAVTEHGFRITSAHTDSPGFKIKAGSENRKAGALRVTAEVYGGPILATWFDRELSIAGRVLLRGEDGYTSQCFDFVEPCAVIPNVAIHLNRDVNKGVEYNIQTQMQAVLSVTERDREESGYIRVEIARRLGIEPEVIRDYDLFLYPAERGRVIGPDKDMFVSGRIDNLGTAYAAVTSLLESKRGEATSVAVLFDSEEIGSTTWQGARSSFLRDLLHRIVLSAGGPGDAGDSFFRALARSCIVTGDAAHAVHPNYSEKHDESFTPMLNKGPAIKIHAGGAYTTTAGSGAKFVDMCERHDIPVQRFLNRSDMPSGSTIGPITSANLGIPSVDIGNPIWGMHSARETGGVHDQGYLVKALKAFYEEGLP
jgi:aspartyl aminopeptidase